MRARSAPPRRTKSAASTADGEPEAVVAIGGADATEACAATPEPALPELALARASVHPSSAGACVTAAGVVCSARAGVRFFSRDGRADACRAGLDGVVFGSDVGSGADAGGAGGGAGAGTGAGSG